MKDKDLIYDELDLDSIHKDMYKIGDNIMNISKIVDNEQAWTKFIIEKKGNIDDFSSLLLSDNTKNIIKQNNGTNLIQNIIQNYPKIKESLIKDVDDLKNYWNKKKELIDDIGYIYAYMRELIESLDYELNLLINDLELVFGEISNTRNIKDIKKKVLKNIMPIIEIKDKYKNRIGIVVVPEILKKNGVVSHNKKDVTRGLVILLHGCYYFDYSTDDVNDILFGGRIEYYFSTSKVLSIFYNDQPTSIILKENGYDGKNVEICSSWGKNQKTYTILFGIFIILSIICFIVFIGLSICQCSGNDKAKFMIVGTMLTFVIISLVTLIITSNHNNRDNLTSAGEKHYSISVPQYADSNAIATVVLFFIGYLLSFGCSVGNLMNNSRKEEFIRNISKSLSRKEVNKIEMQ